MAKEPTQELFRPQQMPEPKPREPADHLRELLRWRRRMAARMEPLAQQIAQFETRLANYDGAIREVAKSAAPSLLAELTTDHPVLATILKESPSDGQTDQSPPPPDARAPDAPDAGEPDPGKPPKPKPPKRSADRPARGRPDGGAAGADAADRAPPGGAE